MTIKFTVPDELMKSSFDEIISPVMKRKPRWMSLLPSRGSVKSCPAFTWLFKDSLIVRLPCDLMLNRRGDNFIVESMNDSLMSVYTHDLAKQLSEEHAKEFINIKVMPKVSFQSKRPIKAVQMTAFNYTIENEMLFRSVEGVFPFIKEATHLNINMFLRTSELVRISEMTTSEESVLLSRGTPLCMLYFPDGLPKYKVVAGDIMENSVWYRYKDFKSGISRYYYGAFKDDA